MYCILVTGEGIGQGCQAATANVGNCKIHKYLKVEVLLT